MARRKKRGKRQKGRKKVQQPASKSYVIRNKFKAPLENLRFHHREYICDLVSDGTATKRYTRYINPGLSESFSWLSAIADRFETYTFNNLTFEYVSSVGTDVAGTVMLAPDYDPADDNDDLTKAQLYSFSDSMRTPVWQSADMVCRRKNLNPNRRLFTRSISDLKPDLDIKTYDFCKLEVLIDNADTGVTMGELWVNYDITFFTPQQSRAADDCFNGGLDGVAYDTTIPWYNMTDEDVDYTTGCIAKNAASDSRYQFLQPGIYQMLTKVKSATGMTLIAAPTLSGAVTSTITDLGYKIDATGVGGIRMTNLNITARDIANGLQLVWTGITAASGTYTFETFLAALPVAAALMEAF